MPSRFRADKAAGTSAVIQYDVSGEGGGTWHAVIKDGTCAVRTGPSTGANLTLQINQCSWSDNVGDFSGRATWSRESQAAEFQGRSTLDAKRFLEAVGFPQLLADATFKRRLIVRWTR